VLHLLELCDQGQDGLQRALHTDGEARPTDHLIARLFKPERLAAILSSLSARRAQKAESVSSRLMALQQEVTDAEEKLARLYRLVEEGLTYLDDVLKGRLAALKVDRDRTKAALERAKEQLRPQILVDPALIERFGRIKRENLSTGSVPFRKAYLQSLIASIEVDDHKVRIRGSKDLLEKAVFWNQNGQARCSQMSTEWCARQDETGHRYVIACTI
jgi:site-specific DNA recombinase